MPEAPPPLDLTQPCSSAEAAARSSTDSAAAVASNDIDDVILTPDQIRPAMRELGDSVTSAVKFENDEDDEESQTSNSNSGEAATSTAVAVAAAAGRELTPAQRVLAAREALLAERAGSAGTAGGGGDGDAGPRLNSSGSGGSSNAGMQQGRWGWVEMGPVAAGGAVAAAGTATAVGVSQQQQQQQPYSRLRSPFGTAVAQQQFLPQPQQQQDPVISQQGSPTAVSGHDRAHSSPRSFEQLPQPLPSQQQQKQQQGHLPSSSSPAAAAAASAGAVPYKPRTRSPFAVAYDFSQLAGALPTHNSSSNSSAVSPGS